MTKFFEPLLQLASGAMNLAAGLAPGEPTSSAGGLEPASPAPAKWDLRLLSMAKFISGWSKDPSTKVGAVFALERRIISLGYNGLPQGIASEGRFLQERDLKLETIIHAEMNALIFARAGVRGATLYTYPFAPCSRCTSVMIQAGVVRVVAPPPLKHWAENCLLAAELLREAGVVLDIIAEEWLRQSDP